MRTAWFLGLLVACGHPPGASPDTPKSTPAAAADAAIPSGPPLVTVGERMTYKVALKGFELASYTLAVGDLVDFEGKKAITIQAHAKLAGIAAWFGGKVDDRFTSWIDVGTGRSLRFQVDEFASKSNNTEHTVIDLAKRANDVVPVSFHLNSDTPVSEPQKAQLPETWDYNAFLVAMRSWEAPPGSTQSFEIFRSRYMWNVKVTMKGKTKLKVDLPDVSEMRALRIDAHTYKLARDGSKFPDTEERDFTMWISDDGGRVPLQINARTDYGDVVMQIVDYQPGTGEPLRQ